MTYFLLSIANACNKSCDYCAVKPWLNNPAYPDKITAGDLTAFLSRELKENDAVELTGGEPTLFPDLLLLLDFLKENGAKTIIRTNGFKLGEWRKNYENAVVVLARHDSGDEYMDERKKHLLPQDLILDGIPEHIKQKEQDKPIFENNEASPLSAHPFARSMFITADGNIRFMPCADRSIGNIIGLNYKLEEWHCLTMQKCPYMLGAWNLIARLGKWSR